MDNLAVLDKDLIQEAMEISGFESDVEMMNQALREFIDGRTRFADWMELRGKIKFADGYDYKEGRVGR